MAKVRLLDNSGYRLNLNLKGVEINAEMNCHGAWAVKTDDLVKIGMDEGIFDVDEVYFISDSIEVLED